MIETRISPEYIRLSSTAAELLCLVYVSVTAASGDLRHWNGGFGKQCDKPWYPSSALLPGTDQRPPCVWLNAVDTTPLRDGVSWHLTDFAPDTAPKAQTLGEQWQKFPNTLCRALVRMQFWKREFNPCIPYYKKSLIFTPEG